jgi:Family of unknown function (DUF6788)
MGRRCSPDIQWTRTVNGKTVTRRLTQAQYEAYASWFGNARRLRALTTELGALSLEEMARAEGWAKITPGTQAPPRTRPARVPRHPKTPKPPKSWEISPLNAGSEPRKRPVTPDQQVLSLTHGGQYRFLTGAPRPDDVLAPRHPSLPFRHRSGVSPQPEPQPHITQTHNGVIGVPSVTSLAGMSRAPNRRSARMVLLRSLTLCERS